MQSSLEREIHLARQHTIGDVLRRTASRQPTKLAIQCGKTKWSYQQFDAICNQIARHLISKGLKVGDKVAVVARNSHGFAALRFALARIGAVLVPVNFMLNADEIGFILRSSKAKVLALGPESFEVGMDARLKESSIEFTIGIPGEHSVSRRGTDLNLDEMQTGDPSPIDIDLHDRLLAQIVFTSGTEALPKGAMLTHGAIMWQYMSCIIDGEMHAKDVMLHALPLYHCAQLDAFLGPAVYLGMTNIITQDASPHNVLPLLETHGITSFFAPPSVWISLLRSPMFGSIDFTRLEKGYYGASIMPVEILNELQQRLPRLRLWNLYGQTEIAPLATVLYPEDQIRKAGSAGVAAINVETRVVNENMQDVKPGEVGEIVHRSPQLMLGYYEDPHKSKDAFAGGWFHSGDLATRDEEGHITVVDRKKDMINSGGENVASREVEECIYLLQEISEVAVIALPDPLWIEAVTAVVTLKKEQSITEDAIINHCRKHLAGFKTPKKVIFAESLPKNPSGKVLKRELRNILGINETT
ncbi:MAG: acyl-CoA synthetase [Rhodospirillaceae bacterium]|nr:acyl-CoA synthetase [Rhodospirillaceae bacterium]